MARKSEVVVDVNEETIDYKAENEKLKKEIEELKQMMNTLLKQSNVQATPVTEDTNINKDIPHNKLIKVMSLFHGDLLLRTATGKIIRFYNFGTVKPITFGDLIEICDGQRRLAEEGYFMILDKDAVDALYLTEAYKKIVGKEVIENIVTLPDKEIKEIIENVNEGVKEAIIDTIVKGINDNNPKFLDRNKIEYIGNLLGKDLYRMAEQLRNPNNK